MNCLTYVIFSLPETKGLLDLKNLYSLYFLLFFFFFFNTHYIWSIIAVYSFAFFASILFFCEQKVCLSAYFILKFMCLQLIMHKKKKK